MLALPPVVTGTQANPLPLNLSLHTCRTDEHYPLALQHRACEGHRLCGTHPALGTGMIPALRGTPAFGGPSGEPLVLSTPCRPL